MIILYSNQSITIIIIYQSNGKFWHSALTI